MAVAQVSALLLACFFESVAYGFAFILFILSMQTLLRKKRSKGSVNKPLMICAPILFAFVTLHIAGVMIRTFNAFITYPEGPEAYFAQISTTEKLATQAGQIGSVFIGDALSVYRVWAVWQRNFWATIPPLLTLIATIICGVTFVQIQHKSATNTSIFADTITRWTESFLSTSLLTTVLSTSLIAFKLWHVQAPLRRNNISSSSLCLTKRVTRILVESVALYSTANLLYTVLYAAKTNVEAIFSGLTIPMVSVTFSFIILRLEKAVNSLPTSSQTTLPNGTTEGSNDTSDIHSSQSQKSTSAVMIPLHRHHSILDGPGDSFLQI